MGSQAPVAEGGAALIRPRPQKGGRLVETLRCTVSKPGARVCE